MQDKAGELVMQDAADALRDPAKYLLKIPVGGEKVADVAYCLQPLGLTAKTLLHLLKGLLQIVRITFHAGSARRERSGRER